MESTKKRKNLLNHTIINLLMVFAVIGILVVLSILSERYHLRVDVTEGRLYSLSDRTIEILENIDTPLQIKSFYLREDPRGVYLEDLLEEFTQYTDKIDYQFIDPELEPAAAERYIITTYNTVLFEANEKRMNIFVTDEQSIIRAISRIVSPERRTAYFLTGHGERDIDNEEGSGYSQIRDLLEINNFTVNALNLATTGQIPSEIAFLVIPGPRQNFLPTEIELIRNYLNSGGRVVYFQDPGDDSDFNQVLTAWGASLNDDIVFDPQQALFGVDPLSIVVDSYLESLITRGIAQTVFFGTRSLEVEPTDRSAVTVLAMTSDDSWSTPVIEGQPREDAPTTPGPLPIIAAIEGSDPQISSIPTRIIVGGDSDFISNTGMVLQGNADLFTNIIDWLADDEILSTIPNISNTRFLTLTPTQARLVLYLGVISLPLILLVVGAIIWWRQR